MTHVINMKHARSLAGAVRIDRRTVWGNPFRIGTHGDRTTVIALYRRELWRRIEAGEIALKDLAGLSGRTLACWCAPEPCHGDVLARAADWAARRLREQASRQASSSTASPLPTPASPDPSGRSARSSPPRSELRKLREG